MSIPIEPSSSVNHLRVEFSGNITAASLMQSLGEVLRAAAAFPPEKLRGFVVDISGARDLELAAAQLGLAGHRLRAFDSYRGLRVALVSPAPEGSFDYLLAAIGMAGFSPRLFFTTAEAVTWIDERSPPPPAYGSPKP